MATLGVSFYLYLGLSYTACVELGRRAEDLGLDGVFVVETYTTDAMAAVEAIALGTRRITVATGIANVYLRHPVLLGAGAVAIDELSGGRMILGVGVGLEHALRPLGVVWQDPRTALRDATTMVQRVFRGESLPGAPRPFRRAIHPIPIHLAALALETAELAGEIADGLMLYVAAPDRYHAAVRRMSRGAKNAGRQPDGITVTLLIPAFVSDDFAAARDAARQFLANYVAMPHYNTFFRRSGFVDAIDRFDAALSGGSRQQAAAHLPDEFIDAVCLVGPAGRCRERLTAFREAGVRYPILGPQPVNEPPGDAIRRVLDAMAGA
jgi:alkanesulfonate monooxygenase SsuD/methylene tetrahydromethanopterin reductase-like flavin-dependent oxidoreductase (luciferase family)